MARKRLYTPKIKISRIETVIAQLRAQGYDERAQGLFDFFEIYLHEDRISEMTEIYKKMLEAK